MKIGIIIGSIREGRLGSAVARWVHELALGRGSVAAKEHEYELIDLKHYPLPLIDAEVIPGAAKGDYVDPQVQAWADTIAGFDAFVFVSPEYNGSIPGPFKNAFDSIYQEWLNKPVVLVVYSFSAGKSVAASWRVPLNRLKMEVVQPVVGLTIPENFSEDNARIVDAESLATELSLALDRIEMTAS